MLTSNALLAAIPIDWGLFSLLIGQPLQLQIRRGVEENVFDAVELSVTKTFTSAVAFSQIKYYRQRPTNDFQFGVANLDEYNELLDPGGISVSHLLLPLTVFLSHNKMTYCTEC